MKNKFKEWYGEHKEGIKSDVVKITYYAVGFGVGCFTMKQLSNLQIAASLSILHTKGIIKFFDPETGLEVGLKRACELCKNLKN